MVKARQILLTKTRLGQLTQLPKICNNGCTWSKCYRNEMRCSSFSSVIALLIFHRTIIALLLKQRSDQMQIMPWFAAETSTQITVKESRMIEQWRMIYTVGKHSLQQYYTHGPSRERQRVYFPHSNNTWTSTQQKYKSRRVARKALGPSKLATHCKNLL